MADDYVVSNLNESKNEWAQRLINILTPHIIDGIKSIFKESYRMCLDNDEEEKYLMTFQNLLSNIPNWNESTIEDEVNRIISASNCNYLTDLISCVHIIQLKILTCVRVGQKQKAISIDVPTLNKFIHKVYINNARQLYSNIYLFENNVPPLTMQKNNRELEVLTRECIFNTVRESIPVESILRAYLDETEEDHEVIEQVKIEKDDAPVEENTSISVEAPPPVMPDSVKMNMINASTSPSLSFSDTDHAIDTNNTIQTVHAPKNIETLERKSEENHQKMLAEQDDDLDEGGEESLKILEGNVNLDILDINDLNRPVELNSAPLLTDIEEL